MGPKLYVEALLDLYAVFNMEYKPIMLRTGQKSERYNGGHHRYLSVKIP